MISFVSVRGKFPRNSEVHFVRRLLVERKRKASLIHLFREMETRLQAVEKVGLGYLELCRGADTLSGGEAQRIRLSVQMKSGLLGYHLCSR
jgi:excinuclease ABC subunit A